MQELGKALSLLEGVAAVGLGGSRGLGMADENSDYDFVLFRCGGKLISTPRIVEAIEQFTERKNIHVVAGLVSAKVEGKKVEVFHKDLNLIENEISLARNGQFRRTIRQLFPHGDISTAVISHVINLELCSEKEECVTRLRKLAEPYPDLLRVAMIKAFMSEVAITAIHAVKIKKATDAQNLFALCSGVFYFANIVIFALNRKYPVLEKGGTRLILDLPLRPQDYEQRIKDVFQAICTWDLAQVSSCLNALKDDLEALVTEARKDPSFQLGQQPPLPQQLKLAAQQIDAGHLRSAEAVLQPILKQQPRCAEAFHLMGVLAHKRGKTGLAVELIGQAIEIQPNMAQFHCNRGEMFRLLNRLDEAIYHGEQAVKLDPGLAAAHSNLGIAYYDKKKYERAAACQQRALELNPSLAQALNNLDNIQRELQV